MNKIIEINNKEYTIKEIKYKDLTSLGDLSKDDMAKKLMNLSAGISEDDFNELSMKVGLKLQKIINDVNGLGEDSDFHQPLKK